MRQVLALGPMPERQLRFLIALATWLSDETRTVRVGFGQLIADSGTALNTARKARRELEAARKLASTVGRGKGNLTVWTVLCLPETAFPAESEAAAKGTSDVDPFSADSKGTSDVDPFTPVDNSPKGTSREPQKVPNEAPKRYQGQRADQREPDMGFNLRAKPSGSLSLPAREAGDGETREEKDDVVIEGKITSAPGGAPTLADRIVVAVGCTGENAEAFIQHMRRKPNVRSATALLNTAIKNGTIADLYAEESASAITMAEMYARMNTAPTAPPSAPEPRPPVQVVQTPSMPTWKTVKCPVCEAAPGQFCHRPGTADVTSTHKGRQAEAVSQ